MSAFVVGHAHITALVDLALHGPSDGGHQWRVYNLSIAQWDGTALGRLLLRQNVASVNYRYRNEVGERPEDYRYTPSARRRRPTAVEGLAAIVCYEYQACEDPGWATSDAAGFCAALRDALIRALPGYDDAPWEWTGA